MRCKICGKDTNSGYPICDDCYVYARKLNFAIEAMPDTGERCAYVIEIALGLASKVNDKDDTVEWAKKLHKDKGYKGVGR